MNPIDAPPIQAFAGKASRGMGKRLREIALFGSRERGVPTPATAEPPPQRSPPLRVAVWGTYDLGKPRVRILLRGLRENGVEVMECHRVVWEGIEDKSQVLSWRERIRLGLRWLASYPILVYRYLRLPHHDAVLVCCMGQLDVPILWPFAKLRHKPIVWDAFLSLYNTVVEDRRLVRPGSPIAGLLYALEWLSCRASARIVLDTEAHASYFAETFRLKRGKTFCLFVGAENDAFPPISFSKPGEDSTELVVLFYGQFIPLHGIEHIVRAAQLAYDEKIRWILIGTGQEEARIRKLIDQAPANVERIRWIDYPQLRNYIARADICLGIFGATEKAEKVIPNKVFQIIAVGAPLITRDSPAMRELVPKDVPGLYLVAPADPHALIAAIHKFRAERGALPQRPLHRDLAARINPRAIGMALKGELEKLAAL